MYCKCTSHLGFGLVANAEITHKYPSPYPDRKVSLPAYPLFIGQGEASSVNSLGRTFWTSGVPSLGATGRIWLVPDHCPDGSAECGDEIYPHYCPDNPGWNGGRRPHLFSYQPQHLRGTAYEQTFTIHNNFMRVRIEADQEAVAEGTAATFTLHRQGGRPGSLAKTLEVQIQATQEGDYIAGAAPRTVTFQANSATATLSIPTSNDMVDEEDGSVTARLLRPIGCTDDSHCYEIGEYEGTSWEVRSVTTAVTGNDYVPPPVFVADATGKENGGTIEFTVSLDRPNHEEASSVDWATREDGTDFTAASGTPNFAVGETEKTFRVALLNDDMDENHKTFNIVLSNPSELTLGTGTATGTILDDELAFAVIFTSQARASVVEGEELVLRMQRLAPAGSGQVVSVDDPCYEQSIIACFDDDASVGNEPLTVNVRVTQEGDVISGTAPTTATFAPGSKYAYLTIQTDDDLTVEDQGVIKAEVLNGSGYSPLFVGLAEHPDDYLPTHIRTVYDNDLTFSVGDATADEDAGTLDFTVGLNAPAPRELTVATSTVNGDATSHASVTTTSLGQDFTALSQTLAFLKGEQATTFSVPLVNDSIQERDETFSVQLSNPPEHSTLADSAGVGTIVDDEQPIMATVSRTYSTVDEGQAGPVMYLVELSHLDTVVSEQDIAVGWQVTAGTATEGEDYLAAGGTYNFPAGTTSGFLDVSLVDDNLFEAELETFTVELIPQGTSLATLSTTGAAVETSIRDNETLTALITADTGAVAEGHVAVFRATLFGDLTAQATSVQFGALGDATAGEDYGIPYGSLTIPAGDLTGRAERWRSWPASRRGSSTTRFCSTAWTKKTKRWRSSCSGSHPARGPFQLC